MRKFGLIFVFMLMFVFGSGLGFGLDVYSPSVSSGFVNYQATNPGYQSYYSTDQITTYWPILGQQDKSCDGRQDILLQVPLGGCQPTVVRSDLLADQNVPVFCQISALQTNPLLNIKNLRNIRFTQQYPKEVAGVGFHPAQAALNTRDVLIGNPLTNNIGYVVVVLRQNEIESSLPDSVTVNLSGQIEYDAGNALGIGTNEFILEPESDVNWQTDKLKQSFWQGRYFIRLESMDVNYATISIYQGDSKIFTTRLKKGETSTPLYIPGFYCQAQLQGLYVGGEVPKTKARLVISDGDGTNGIDVYEGSTIINGKCVVGSIRADNSTQTGSVDIRCPNERFTLQIGSKTAQGIAIFVNSSTGKFMEPTSDGGYYSFDFGQKGIYGMAVDPADNVLKKFGRGGSDLGYPDVKNSEIYAKASPADRAWIDSVEAAFIKYKQIKSSGGSVGVAVDKTYDANVMKDFKEAIKALEDVADGLPAEISGPDNRAYGELALQEAIRLAGKYGLQSEQLRLMGKFISLYPNSNLVSGIKNDMGQIQNFDTSKSGYSTLVDNSYRNIVLTGFSIPAEKAQAKFTVDGIGSISLGEGEQKVLDRQTSGNSTTDFFAKLTSIRADGVTITSNCWTNDSTNRATGIRTYTMNLGGTTTSGIVRSSSGINICGRNFVLDDIDLKQVARIRLTPQTLAGGNVNLSVTIGIEKRAIQLSPNKTAEKIATLNETIKKWQSISDSMGKVVSGMKGACFATAAILTFKNLMTGLSGETIARQKIMGGDNGWTKYCKTEVAKAGSKYVSMDDCFRQNSDAIDKDVSSVQSTVTSVNSQIDTIEKKYTSDGGDIFGGSYVQTDKAKADLLAQMKSEFPGNPIAQGMTTDDSYGNVRDAYLDLKLNGTQGLSSVEQNNLNSDMKKIQDSINQRAEFNQVKQAAAQLTNQGLPHSFVGGSYSKSVVNAEIKPIGGMTDTGTEASLVAADPKISSTAVMEAKGGPYILGLAPTGNGVYGVSAASNGSGVITGSALNSLLTENGVSSIREVTGRSYNNRIINPQVSYYETEPYKGMPAIVPFDVTKGWYAATQQTLPTFGGIGAFDSSGRVASFWVCNVGTNGLVEFNEGLGDDTCQQINVYTGQAYNVFPGLSDAEAKNVINQARAAIDEAARQYGKGTVVTINGQRMQTGQPVTNVPGAQCQDFMSPKDCLLMFNVCDPVICPASRCNLGGTYHVTDVVQSGIVGSIFLCLPNVKEGIAIPVCLSGIKAGLDAYISVIQSYKDCLQENLNSGKMTGICDQIYSIYLCEFFWNQIAPVANLIIPKLLETMYGQGTRGGGEYMTVSAAWTNMQGSINYFTQSYAVNSMKAFQARSIADAGTEVCKSYISVAGPKTISSLLAPDSPPQFYASFSSTVYSSATVPATSDYKVFYHIFSGKDSGTYYSVYLKSPPESSFYYTTPYVYVASGFIAAGQYKSETKDFTAPEGYKELCVRINDRDECGFKEVTTDFAANYVADSIAQNEIQKTNINSESECISGSPSINPLSTNLQQAAQGAVAPQVYNSGVVRICATDNPGKTTNPGRFVNVGNCGDSKITCWLDKNSVSNAITSSNAGIINSTLANLQQTQLNSLIASGQILAEGDAQTAIDALNSREVSLRGSVAAASININDAATSAVSIAGDSDTLMNRIFINRQRAMTMLVKGKALADRSDARLQNLAAVIGTNGGNVSGQCGNGVIDSNSGEQCDLSAPNGMGGQTCATVGSYVGLGFNFAGGTLGCYPALDDNQCRFDYSKCTETTTGTTTGAAVCGNGIREGTEQCDKNDFGGKTCLDYSYPNAPGSLSCSSDCRTIDSSTCSSSQGTASSSTATSSSAGSSGAISEGDLRLNSAYRPSSSIVLQMKDSSGSYVNTNIIFSQQNIILHNIIIGSVDDNGFILLNSLDSINNQQTLQYYTPLDSGLYNSLNGRRVTLDSDVVGIVG